MDTLFYVLAIAALVVALHNFFTNKQNCPLAMVLGVAMMGIGSCLCVVNPVAAGTIMFLAGAIEFLTGTFR